MPNCQYLFFNIHTRQHYNNPTAFFFTGTTILLQVIMHLVIAILAMF